MRLFEEFEFKLNEYMGIGMMGVLFVCAVLFWILKKEKSRQMRFYVAYVLVMFVAMINPATLYVVDKTGNMGVYERFFWLLMTTFFVSFTLVALIGKRTRLIIPCIILLLLGGKSVFTDIEYQKAQNAEKINQEAIEVADIIMRDFEGLPEGTKVMPNRYGIESPRAVIPEPINEDIRMYNANIEMWYVREGFGSYNKRGYRQLARLMSMENSQIPAKKLFRFMNKKDFQYFVLGNWQELTGETEKYDFKQIGQTETYRVYRYNEKLSYRMIQYADVNDYQCMSYLIYSSHGGLIVVDGGRAWQSESLVKEIKARGGVVDSWIITHAHDDHAGVLASVLEAEWHKTEIEIKEILIGEMDIDAVRAEGSSKVGMVDYLQMGLDKHENVRVLRAGDELDVIGLQMKVLHTCNETVVENSDNILNDGSMVFKLSSQNRSVLFLADTADNTPEIAAQITDPSQGSEIGRLIADEILANYPEDVQSWAVQMSHHGNGSYPDYFYEAIAPKYAFFSAPDWLMENRNKETGETSYYSTPHYVELMKNMGTRIISFDTKKQSIKLK